MCPSSAMLISLDTLCMISRASGTLSLFTWLFAQLPQVLENHLNKLVEGVSLLFLLLWSSGDASNLIGCLLTGALPFQTLLAAYYCFIDSILGLQYWYYTRIFPRQRNPIDLLQSPKPFKLPYHQSKSPHYRVADGRRNRFEDQAQVQIQAQAQTSQTKIRKSKVLPAFVAAALSIKDASASSIRAASAASTIDPSSITLITDSRPISSHFSNIYAAMNAGIVSFLFSSNTWGKAFAWTCSVLYLSSRAPQISKNYRNQSTKGVTVYLFLCAMFGNIFYSVSVITDLLVLEGTDQPLFDLVFPVQLPFLVGSMGTVCFDFILIVQCWMYRSNTSLDPPEFYPPLPRRANSRKAIRQRANSRRANSRRANSQKAHYDRRHDAHRSSPTEPEFMIEEHDQTAPMTEFTALLKNPILSEPCENDFGSFSAIRKAWKMASASDAPEMDYTSPGARRSASFLSIHGTKGDWQRSQDTSLIPELVGSYISISRKMISDTKSPFLPSDFLANDFGGRAS